MIDYKIIATGSQGNAVIINKKVLIDFGISFKRIQPYLDDIKIVLATHSHGDHFKASTARLMALNKPLLRFGCCGWMKKHLLEAGVPDRQIDVYVPGVLYDYKAFGLIPFEVTHDVPNCGYKLFFANDKVFYATDCGNLNGIIARGYDLYLLEANYEDEEIQARMDAKRAEGKYAYEQRALKYHLSKKQCDDFIYRNAGPKSEYVYLHCHEDRGNEGENHSV